MLWRLSLRPDEISDFSEQLNETIKERMEYEIEERRHQESLKMMERLLNKGVFDEAFDDSEVY